MHNFVPINKHYLKVDTVFLFFVFLFFGLLLLLLFARPSAIALTKLECLFCSSEVNGKCCIFLTNALIIHEIAIMGHSYLFILAPQKVDLSLKLKLILQDFQWHI